MIHIKIFGEPVAKGRPKFRKMGKFVQTYTPTKTMKEEKRLKEALKSFYDKAPLSGPLAVDLHFSFGIPKSYTKKRIKEIESNGYYHTNKPDCDNLAKLVLDAMNGIIYEDDKQIYSLHIVKKYVSPETDDPNIEIFIGGLNDDTTRGSD